MLNSIEQAKRAHTGNWFAPETMKWWGTRLCTAQVWPVSDGILFVTSDKPGFAADRTYQVRFCSDAGKIDTLVEFTPEGKWDGPWRHATAVQASRSARMLREAWTGTDSDGNIPEDVALAVWSALNPEKGR